MNPRVVAALIGKDLALYLRNKFFVILTVLGLAVYILIYFVMPASVDETLQMGLYAPDGEVPPVFQHLEVEGLDIQTVASEDDLRQAVISGRYSAGLALQPDFMELLMSGQKPVINVYFGPDAPAEVKEAIAAIVRELTYVQVGQPLPLEISQEIVGPDMIGRQVPPRDRLRPVFAVLLLITETLFLATLLSEEIERRTVQALLVTPMKVRDLLVAKGAVGVSLAFTEALLFMAIVGGLTTQPLPIIVALLLGGVMVTGISFLLATVGRDMMSVMAWGIPVMVLLIVPAVSILFPGTLTGWIEVIPSYYLAETVNQAANFGGGWGDVWVNLLALAAFGLAFFWIGSMVLVRRFR
jgi:ABC-2 type transport system permease protein